MEENGILNFDPLLETTELKSKFPSCFPQPQSTAWRGQCRPVPPPKWGKIACEISNFSTSGAYRHQTPQLAEFLDKFG